MDKDEKKTFRDERERLRKLLSDLEHGEQGFDAAVARLESLRDGLTEETQSETTRGLVSWVGSYLQIVERLVLVPAQARLESIVVEPIDLAPEDALHVALANRLDFMNGQAALVDRWRLVQVNADALQSVVNITGSGNLRTARNNPASFRAPTGTVRLGLEFDAPFTRLLERNAYRESIIEYQRSRRDLIQSRDGLHLGLRQLLRQIKQLRQNLEIQRRSVTIAMRRVDQTQLNLSPPRQPVQPGQRPPINQTLAIQLLGAQTALRDSQNAFLGVWLNYYATKLRLYRELGIMVLDPEGRWIEYPIGGSDLEALSPGGESGVEELPLPPMIPAGWMDALYESEEPSQGPPRDTVERASYFVASEYPTMLRLPPTESTVDTSGYKLP